MRSLETCTHVIPMPALMAHPKILVSNLFCHHQTHDKNVLISGIYTHIRHLRNETSAWRHIVGITQILVIQKMAINVIGPSGPLSRIHEAHVSFRSAEVGFH